MEEIPMLKIQAIIYEFNISLVIYDSLNQIVNCPLENSIAGHTMAKRTRAGIIYYGIS